WTPEEEDVLIEWFNDAGNYDQFRCGGYKDKWNRNPTSKKTKIQLCQELAALLVDKGFPGLTAQQLQTPNIMSKIKRMFPQWDHLATVLGDRTCNNPGTISQTDDQTTELEDLILGNDDDVLLARHQRLTRVKSRTKKTRRMVKGPSHRTKGKERPELRTTKRPKNPKQITLLLQQ
ncbi:hypothetical protein DFS34DRAFT_604943, partial [Phlyctochytrium arcticum]